VTHVVGIDPGNTTGFAWFLKGQLSCAYARSFEEFIAEPPCFQAHMDVVIEFPKWRPHSHEEVDDLLGLAEKAGRIEQFYVMQRKRVQLVWPHAWKGSVPKDVHNQRVLKTLTAEEVALLPRRPRSKKNPYDHNCIDAVGIGLWKLGRMR
jgi:hypothetical protein